MLFSDFFPRLRDHAWHRYGQTITERQFKDWREETLSAKNRLFPHEMFAEQLGMFRGCLIEREPDHALLPQ